MRSIESRIAALTVLMELREAEQEYPVDPLSQSLLDFGEWLSSLGEQEIADEAAELGLAPEDMERFIASFRA